MKLIHTSADLDNALEVTLQEDGVVLRVWRNACCGVEVLKFKDAEVLNEFIGKLSAAGEKVFGEKPA